MERSRIIKNTQLFLKVAEKEEKGKKEQMGQIENKE